MSLLCSKANPSLRWLLESLCVTQVHVVLAKAIAQPEQLVCARPRHDDAERQLAARDISEYVGAWRKGDEAAGPRDFAYGLHGKRAVSRAHLHQDAVLGVFLRRKHPVELIDGEGQHREVFSLVNGTAFHVDDLLAARAHIVQRGHALLPELRRQMLELVSSEPMRDLATLRDARALDEFDHHATRYNLLANIHLNRTVLPDLEPSTVLTPHVKQEVLVRVLVERQTRVLCR
mmetsp:Transcript_11197/g.29840  ORF Transcript_11197/g.29840 Transcript_11197/m.29840 type:complete len:232 (-) Transcript_11197:271-966(-)